jgi:tRNA dimethylallyltransferase
MGATATGKTAAAVALCARFKGEIVSMDSRQVYRGLDVGTGKPTADEQRAARHHLIDVIEPHETWSAGRHAAAARAAIEEIAARGNVPFLVGGTGLYFRALLGGLADVAVPEDVSKRLRAAMDARSTDDLYDELALRDPERAAQLSRADRVRITRALEIMDHTGRTVSDIYADGATTTPCRVKRLVLTLPRPALRERIDARTRAFVRAGWVEEVRGLLAGGVPADAPGMKSLGYGEIAEALAGGRPMEPVIDRVILRTRQYAKRQETFFRGEPDALWVDVSRDGALDVLGEATEALIST